MNNTKKARIASTGSETSLTKNTVTPSISDTPPNDAIEFLSRLGGANCKFTFQTFDDVKIDDKARAKNRLADVMHGTFKEHYHRLKALNEHGAGVFVTINETDLKGRKNANIISARAVWQDDDIGLGDLTLPEIEPSMVVESSAGKYHRYWLTSTEDLCIWDAVQLTMTLEFGCDPACKDRARVLRLPGFIHQKDPKKPFLVKIVESDGPSYTWENLISAIPPTIKQGKSTPLQNTATDQPAMLAKQSRYVHDQVNMLSAIAAYPLEESEASFTLFTRAVAAAGCAANDDTLAIELVTAWNHRCKEVGGYDKINNYKKLERFIQETREGKNLTPPEHIYKATRDTDWTPPANNSLNTISLAMESFDQIPEKKIDWLWPGHIPIGKFTLFGGDAGLNKSTLCLAIAATVTNGSEWPDGSSCTKGEVIIMSSEDDPSDTIKPRLRLAGADLERVHYLSFAEVYYPQTKEKVKTAFSLVHHLPLLDDKLQKNPNISLLIVDPITAYCSGLKNPYDASEIRSTLAPLLDLLAKNGVALVALTHLNKSEGASALHRFNGSGAWVQVARSTWLVGRDPNEEMGRLLLPVKNNLAPDSAGIAFDISIEDDHPVVTWVSDPIEMTADQFMGITSRSKKPSKVNEASTWLKDLLKSGPILKTDIDILAKDYDFSETTLRRAKKAISVVSRRFKTDTADIAWEWYLPDHSDEILEDDGQGGQTISAPPLSPAGDHLEQDAQNDSQGVQTITS